MEEILRELRTRGWRVAVHNDYRVNGVDMTFWLMTHSLGAFLKGEAKTDLGALRIIKMQCDEQQLVRLPTAPGTKQLRAFGYAPGDYMTRCLSCDAIKEDMDKLATSCRDCATSRYQGFLRECSP